MNTPTYPNTETSLRHIGFAGRTMVMSLQCILVLLAAVAILAGPALACAGDLAGDTQRSLPKLSADQRAISACVTALNSRMHPSGGGQVRTVIPPSSARVFSDLDASDRESAKVMKLTMTAYVAGTKEPLAKAECTVDNRALVIDLFMTVLNSARLEQLSLNDIRLTIGGG